MNIGIIGFGAMGKTAVYRSYTSKKAEDCTPVAF